MEENLLIQQEIEFRRLADLNEYKRQYRREIRKTGGKCALILLVLGVTAQAFSLGITFILRAVSMKNGGELQISEGMLLFLQGYLPCLMADFVAIAIAFALFRPNFADGVFSLSQGDKKFTMFSAFGAIGAGNIGSSVFAVLLILIGISGSTFTIPEMSDPKDSILATIFNIGYACLIGPILEEIIFRGLLLKQLERFGAMTAIIVSSVMFGMMHLNPMQFPGACLIGLVLGYLTVKTHSIYPAIIVHIVNNSLRTVPTLFFDITSPFMIVFSYGLIIFGGIFLIIFLLKYGRGFTNLLKFEDLRFAKVGHKITAICMSPFSIAYILFVLWAMVRFFTQFVK